MGKWSATRVIAMVVLLVAATAAVALATRATEAAPAGTLPLVFLLGAAAAVAFAAMRRGVQARLRERGRLRASERRFQHLVDTAHEGIWVVDTATRTTYVNARLAGMFGCDAATMRGRPLADFLGANPATALAALTDHGAAQSGRVHDLCYRRSDGSHGWAMASSRAMDDGANTLLMLSDISERKQAELALADAHQHLEAKVALRTAELLATNEQLRAEVAVRKTAERALALSERRTQAIIAAIPLPLFIKDAGSRVTLMNRAAERQWGAPFAEVFGTRASAWFSPEQHERFLAADAAAFAGRKLVVIEETVWHAALQEERLLQTYKKPIYDAGGAPESLICVSVDITDRQRADARLQQSFAQLRRLAAQLEMSKQEERRNIALDIHDQLGQNLMALKIDVELLHARTAARHGLLHARAGTTLATIDASIRSARAIINELHPGTLELGLAPALEWLMGRLGQRHGVATIFIINGSPSVPEDARRNGVLFSIIQQALLSVLRHASAAQLKLTLEHDDGALLVGIAGNGSGLSGSAAAEVLQSLDERVILFGGTLLIDGGQLSIALPAPAFDNGAAVRAAQPQEARLDVAGHHTGGADAAGVKRP